MEQGAGAGWGLEAAVEIQCREQSIYQEKSLFPRVILQPFRDDQMTFGDTCKQEKKIRREREGPHPTHLCLWSSSHCPGKFNS